MHELEKMSRKELINEIKNCHNEQYEYEKEIARLKQELAKYKSLELKEA
jgi:hypothetical protein